MLLPIYNIQWELVSNTLYEMAWKYTHPSPGIRASFQYTVREVGHLNASYRSRSKDVECSGVRTPRWSCGRGRAGKDVIHTRDVLPRRSLSTRSANSAEWGGDQKFCGWFWPLSGGGVSSSLGKSPNVELATGVRVSWEKKVLFLLLDRVKFAPNVGTAVGLVRHN